MENNGESQAGFLDGPGQASVAIIEDNVEIVELYVMLIKARGMRVCFVAHDGDAGVKAFKAAASPPDIVLIDHRMPIKSGLATMREIRALHPVARFIFISADEDLKDVAIAAGACVFLTKPVSLKEISDAMKNTLASDDK
jgi:DNA-binding response OmpR family regulator